jgi:hypothetical protein
VLKEVRVKKSHVFVVILFLLAACVSKKQTSVTAATMPATKTPTTIPVTITPSGTPYTSISAPETSPDGTWTASYIVTDNSDGLVFGRQDNSVEWVVDYYTLYGSQHGSGKGVGGLNFFAWSDDGKFAYVVPVPERDGPGLWFGGGATLIRLDLQDGSWEDLNVGSSWSMHENSIVYSADDGVRLRDMTNGKEQLFVVPDKYDIFGRYVWSPDGSRVAFTAAYGDWYEGENGFSVILIDFSKNSVTTLLKDDLRFLYPIEWDDEGQILMKKEYQILMEISERDQYYYFDLATKKISAAPTPIPKP